LGINDSGQVVGWEGGISGSGITYGFLASPVTTPPNATTITLPSSSTGNLGEIGGNGPTVIDASMTNGVTFSVGNGPVTIVAGPGDVIQAGNGPETIYGAPGATLKAGTGPDTLYTKTYWRKRPGHIRVYQPVWCERYCKLQCGQ
jgi:hypothetical protein